MSQAAPRRRRTPRWSVVTGVPLASVQSFKGMASTPTMECFTVGLLGFKTPVLGVHRRFALYGGDAEVAAGFLLNCMTSTWGAPESARAGSLPSRPPFSRGIPGVRSRS
jgi:hypothetical protein